MTQTEKEDKQMKVNVKQITTRCLAGCWLLASVAMAQTGGNVRGVIADEKGKPYTGGVRVLAVLLAQKIEGFQPFVTHTVSKPDGSYQLSGLPVGKYEICLATFGGDYVDMCRWGKEAGSATVTSGATTALNLSLTKGKIYTIDFQDDDGYFERHEGKSPGGFIALGVFTAQKDFVDAQLVRPGKNARQYQVVVPVGVSFRVRAISPLFDFKTENEAVLPLRVAQDTDQVILDSDTTKGIKLKVSGLKSQEAAK